MGHASSQTANSSPWPSMGPSLTLQPYLLSPLFAQPSFDSAVDCSLVISQRCYVLSPHPVSMRLMINKDRIVQKTGTHSTPPVNIMGINVWKPSYNHLVSFLRTSHGLCPGELSPKSLALNILWLLFCLCSPGLSSSPSSNATSTVKISLTHASLLILPPTPSTAFIHFLSTGFILLWGIFLGVGAYCHQIGSFLKGLSSITLGTLLGTKHVPLQLCWVEEKNVLLKNWFLGEASQTWWDFHGNSVLERMLRLT